MERQDTTIASKKENKKPRKQEHKFYVVQKIPLRSHLHLGHYIFEAN